MKKIIIIGGYGDGLVIASALEDLRCTGTDVLPYGILNDDLSKGSLIGNLPVLGKTKEVLDFLDQQDVFFITALLKVKESFYRAKKINDLRVPEHRYFKLIHPQATVSKYAELGYGSFIGSHVTIMPNTKIGNHCSLRASASIGHDSHIGNCCYFGPNSTISSGVTIEDGVHVAPNACILEGLQIGSHSVIGAGSVVIRNIRRFRVFFGNPARQIEDLSFDEHKLSDTKE